jgi:hypothetical protein
MTVPRTVRPAYPRPRSRQPAEATAKGGPVVPLPTEPTNRTGVAATCGRRDGTATDRGGRVMTLLARPGGQPEQRAVGQRAGIGVVV